MRLCLHRLSAQWRLPVDFHWLTHSDNITLCLPQCFLNVAVCPSGHPKVIHVCFTFSHVCHSCLKHDLRSPNFTHLRSPNFTHAGTVTVWVPTGSPPSQLRCGFRRCTFAPLHLCTDLKIRSHVFAPLRRCTFAPLHLCTFAPLPWRCDLHPCAIAPLDFAVRPAPLHHCTIRTMGVNCAVAPLHR